MSNIPHALLDTLIKQLKLPNDAALARTLSLAPPVLSKVRHHKLPLGPVAQLRIHEASGMTFRDIRALAAA